MKTRLFTAAWALVIFFVAIWLSDTYVFPIGVAVCSFFSVFEVLRCISMHKKYSISIPLFIIAFALPVLAKDFPYIDNPPAFFLIVLSVVVIYFFAIVVFSHATLDIKEISTAFMTGFYIISGFTSLVMIRYSPENGYYLYWLVFIGAWVTDSFAYFTGFFFGKHKLIPEISPKKTIEGSIGGTVFCIVGFLAFGVVIKHYFLTDIKIDYIMLAIGGLAASIVAQIGDLCMSALKRKYQIKDFGKIFPGHGGMLDRFDSIIPVALILAVLTSVTTFMI